MLYVLRYFIQYCLDFWDVLRLYANLPLSQVRKTDWIVRKFFDSTLHLCCRFKQGYYYQVVILALNKDLKLDHLFVTVHFQLKCQFAFIVRACLDLVGCTVERADLTVCDVLSVAILQLFLINSAVFLLYSIHADNKQCISYGGVYSSALVV